MNLHLPAARAGQLLPEAAALESQGVRSPGRLSFLGVFAEVPGRPPLTGRFVLLDFRAGVSMEEG
jgi:hypothetical protein